MALPTYSDMYRPFLESISENCDHSWKDISEYVANYFSLSDTEREILELSELSTLYNKRLECTKKCLLEAKLIQMHSNNLYQITEHGRNILSEKSEIIDNDTLLRYHEFRNY